VLQLLLLLLAQRHLLEMMMPFQFPELLPSSTCLSLACHNSTAQTGNAEGVGTSSIKHPASSVLWNAKNLTSNGHMAKQLQDMLRWC
jgi:hypothetical protein